MEALTTVEPEAARVDLKAMLAELREARPALGLYFNCCARGSSFFGVPGLEAAYIENDPPAKISRPCWPVWKRSGQRSGFTSTAVRVADRSRTR